MRKLLAPVALILALAAAPAQAMVPVISNLSSATFSDVIAADQPFSQTVMFSLAGPSTLSAFATSQFVPAGAGLVDLSLTFFGPGFSTTVLGSSVPAISPPGGPDIPGFSFVSFAGGGVLPAGGGYGMTLAGAATPEGGSYVWLIQAAAVPEPAEWMLFAAGLALLGVIARRRASLGR